MSKLAEEMDLAEPGDPFAIDYRILPLAPAPSNKPPTLRELFRLGWESSAPYFPVQPEPPALWKRRGT
jgi:hypothetical protein